MHGIQAVELSFVNVPSDHEARVLAIHRDAARAEFFQVPRYRTDTSTWEEVETVKVDEWINRVVTEQVDSGSVLGEAVVEQVESTTASDGGTDRGNVPSDDDEDRLLSGTELWGVDDDQLPDWAHEAKLTAAQRNRLPDSAFCGPNRSFPAHDKAHVLAGLRLLGRAKMSAAQKARVRACLLRRARRFGLPSGKNAPESADGGRTGILLILHPTEFWTYECVEIPSHYTVLSNLEAILEVGRSAESLLHPVRTGSGEVGRSPDGVVFLPSTAEQYEALCATLIPAVTASEDSGGSGEDMEEKESAAESERVAESPPPETSSQAEDMGQYQLERYRSELLDLLRDQFAGELSSDELADAATAILAVSARYEELVGEIDSLREQNNQLRSALESAHQRIDEKQRELDQLRDEMSGLRRQVLVQECVQLAVQAGHPLAARRSVDQLVELFQSRPDSYLAAFAEDMRLAIQEQQAVPTDVVAVAGIPMPDALGKSEESGPSEGALPTSSQTEGSDRDSHEKLMRLVLEHVLGQSISKPEEDTGDTEIWRVYGSLGKPKA